MANEIHPRKLAEEAKAAYERGEFLEAAQAFAAAAAFPDGTNETLFFGVLPEVLAFEFDDEHAPVLELADKVRVKPIGRGLEAERRGLFREVADPEADFGEAVEKLGALEFLGQLTVGPLFPEFSGFWTKVVFLELEGALV